MMAASNEHIQSASPDRVNAPDRLMAGKSDHQSMREKFNTDTRTGGISSRIPIQTSPGRSGFGPSLELVYDSGSASSNGFFGQGWRLTGVDSISRKSSITVPTYDDDQDTFVHSSVGDLVPALDASRKPLERKASVNGKEYCVRQYRPRIESDPIRVERWSCSDGTMLWRTMSQENITTLFGQDRTSRVAYHPDGARELCFSWLACETYDSHGNQMIFSYKAESPDALARSITNQVCEDHRNSTARTTQRYLKSIKYGNTRPNRDLETWEALLETDHRQSWMFEVIFDYGEHTAPAPTTHEDGEWTLRPDPFSVHRSGFEVRTYRRCQRVLMFHHFLELGRPDCLVEATEFQYRADPKSGASLLQYCTPCGYSPSQNGMYSSVQLASTTFEYWTAPDPGSITSGKDMDMDLSGFSTFVAKWVDLNGDGAPGVLAQVPGGGWYYLPNHSADKPAVGLPTVVSPIPNMADSDHWSFEDLTGDGQLDMVFASPDGSLRGFYGRIEDGGWSNFVPFESYPAACSATDRTIVKVDLHGNGSSDLLHLAVLGDNECTWYPSLGSHGYGPEKRTSGAPAVPRRETSFLSCCDMNGDGLSDILMVYNSHVCYWPNMGHGRFGSKVVMANSPFLEDHDMDFSPLRIRMADISGSGTADLIYLPPEGGVRIYYNQSGNGWSDAYKIAAFPLLDRFCAVDVFDIGGRGTLSLCWTSDYLRCRGGSTTTVHSIDLMEGQKPGLLTKYSNGVGGEVNITYRSSTRYRLDDQRAGRPWTTHLPFPIHCVESVVTNNLITQTSCATRYAYHDGYYDPVERQFRGFHMVEKWEAEAFDIASPKPFSRPQVHAKNWFYVGLQRIDDTTILPGSYVAANHPQQNPLPSAKIHAKALTEALTVEEIQDGYRALAGQLRRQEIFGHDGSPRSAIPYLVEQQTYDVVMLQGIPQTRSHGHGIYRVNDSEQVTSHYERDPAQARVQHSLILKTDDYGKVCRRAVIHYGKLESQLPKDSDKQKQKETVIVCTESNYTNAIDPLSPSSSTSTNYFHAPLSAEVRRYRVLPAKTPSDPRNRYSREALSSLLSDANEVSVQESPEDSMGSPRKTSKKLLTKIRTLYSTTDLTNALPVQKLEKFSIEYQSYQLAMSTETLTETLENGVSHLPEGGYVKLDGRNDEWWAPSVRKLFKAILGDNSNSSSRAVAQQNFYIPNAEMDQFGNVSHQELDGYKLLPVKSVDSVKNETLFGNDYVHLKPTLVTDANQNRTKTVFDASGRTVGIAVMGKENQNVGDSLDGFSTTLSGTQFQRFMSDPVAVAPELLANAGKRIIYNDIYRPGVPAFRAELIRDRHYRDGSSQIAVHITYFDGNDVAVQEVALSGHDEPARKWHFSECVLYDSKGEPVREFLPFSDSSHHHFSRLTPSASTPATTFLRDPLNRVVGFLNADRTWSKTRFTPWSQVVFDAGDTVKIEDPLKDDDVGYCFKSIDRGSYYPTWYGEKKARGTDQAAQEALRQSEIYNNTPTTIHKDPLGREILTILDNGLSAESQQDIRESRTEYDVRGNVSVLRDALDRIVTKTWHDLLGRPVHSVNMDSGHQWFLADCTGAPLFSKMGEKPRQRICYDSLRRRKRIMLLSGTPSQEIVLVQYTYGEEQGVQASANNLKGQLYQCRDQSGLQTNHQFDFKGSCVESSVHYATEYRTYLDWSKAVGLEATIYTSKGLFDALSHPVQSTAVGKDGTTMHIIKRTYDIAGRLKSVALSSGGDASVDNIKYSNDNQITRIEYKNGTCATNDYDPSTRRLIKSYTERTTSPRCVQNISYIYDCMGRIVQKADKSQQDVFFANSVVSPLQKFSYDALGQLTKATGREQIDGQQKQLPAQDSCSKRTTGRGNGKEMIQYEEAYRYDKEGNITKLQHTPKANGYQGWTRTYTYTEQSPADPTPGVYSNRLSKTTSTGKVASYKYNDNEKSQNPGSKHDSNGCMTSMPGYSLTWDHDNKLRSFSTQRTTNGTTPEKTWYVYNAQGERVRKVTDNGTSPSGPSSPAKMKETRYLPLRDIYTKYGGPNACEVTTVSVADSGVAAGRTLAMVEIIKDDSTSTPRQPLVRYQVSDHLELDDHSNVISYEEFSPYGVSTYQSRTTTAPRKYRFAGYHRDSESGLYACGARYYAPWLGRWTSADPLGPVDGLNLYSYVQNDPVNFEDHQGTVKKDKKGRVGPEIGTPEKRPGKQQRDQEAGPSSVAGGSTSGKSTRGPKQNLTKPSDEINAGVELLIRDWKDEKIQTNPKKDQKLSLERNEYEERIGRIRNRQNRDDAEKQGWIRIDLQGSFTQNGQEYANIQGQWNTSSVFQLNIATGVRFGAEKIIDAMLSSLHDTEEKFLHPHDAENPTERGGARQREAAQQASGSKKGKNRKSKI